MRREEGAYQSHDWSPFPPPSALMPFTRPSLKKKNPPPLSQDRRRFSRGRVSKRERRWLRPNGATAGFMAERK